MSSSLVLAGAALLPACDFTKTTSLGKVASVDCTVTSTWAEPHPFHWQLHIAQGGAAELRDFKEGEPRLRTAQLGSAQFQLLNDYLEQMHFFDLAPTYASVPRGTDGTEETIVVNCSAGTKSVYTYDGGGPAMLWALQQLLSNIVHDASWTLAQ